jgi:peptidyl-prolyl cis-trans isomerase C
MDRRSPRSGLARPFLIMAFAAVWSDAALAQSVSRSDPSPIAPGDLKAPIFDTKTPIYASEGEQTRSAKTVVAEVEGRAITLGDVADAIAELPPTVRNLPFANLFPGVLDQLVRQEALVIRAHRLALDEDPTIRRKMRAVADRVLGDELLRQETSRSITEVALLERYNKDVAGKPGPDAVHVRVIMVPTEQEATGIIGELRGGADFAVIARRSSKDPSASAGGDTGFVMLDQLTPEVGSVVFALQPGQFTPLPVRSAGGWFVLKVEERHPQRARAFNVVREELRQTMIRERAPDVIKAALADISIRIFDINGKEFETPSAGSDAQAQQ